MLSTILASVTIIIVPIGGMLGNSGVKCGDYSGAYMPQESTMYLCGDYQEFYKYHEIGHHFWYKFLTQKQKDDYAKLYNKALKNGKFYRDYSKSSVEEDFADNFAIIVTKTRHVNTRLAFIRKLLK